MVEKVQEVQKPWAEELTRQEKTLPMVGGQNLKRAAMSTTASTAVGTDGFHPRIPMHLSDELFEEI